MRDLTVTLRGPRDVDLPVRFGRDETGAIVGWSAGDALLTAHRAGLDSDWVPALLGAYRDAWRARGDEIAAERARVAARLTDLRERYIGQRRRAARWTAEDAAYCAGLDAALAALDGEEA